MFHHHKMNSALFLLASSICLVTVYHQALSQRPLCSAPPPPVNGVAPPSPPALQMTCEAQQAAIRNANGGVLQWKPRCSNGQRTVQREFARGYVPQKTTRTLVQVPANRIIPLKPGQNQADTENVQLPESYSTRDTYRSKCPGVDHVLDQGQCGNCWAAASISMINDRACIYSNDNVAQQFYSWEQLTKCVPGGCHGGSPYRAFQYWQNSGLTTGGAPNLPQAPGCLPYPPLGYNMDGTVTGQQCPARCKDGTNIVTKYYGSQPYQIQLNETEVMQEIYLYGPVVAGFNYYQDFQEYSSGVYNHVYGAGDGGHAMKIIGWGVENGTKYWLVQNSWGPKWGIGGFVKFQRGGNECDIEKALNAAVPQDTGIASK